MTITVTFNALDTDYVAKLNTLVAEANADIAQIDLDAQNAADAAAASAASAAASAANAVAVVTGGTATVTPEPGKIPLAAADGRIDQGWLYAVNHIGTPGRPGFGVGICPSLPAGFAYLAGTTDPTSNNYGNYQYQDGSIMCWIPKFYYKVEAGDVVKIAAESAYPDTAAANAAGYALHRAFIDGGAEKRGFMMDKYTNSKNTWGSGTIASSIALGLPLSTAATHNPIYSTTPGVGLTACSANNMANAIDAAHARDGVNGAVNGASIFHVASRFQFGALAMLSLAHGQASAATTWCAWWGASNNFPKGCNNNALKDVNDTAVTFTSDGYPNSALAGSGSPFAKTTHNGQACGVPDLSGNLFEISLGVTSVGSSKSITGATNANPCALTVAAHGFTTGMAARVATVGGMTELNDKVYRVTVQDANTVTLDGVDSSAFTTYTSGGTILASTFYAAKEATAMKAFTSGNSGATDHWGATGIAAMMDAFTMPLRTDYPNNGFSLRIGNGANAVLASGVDATSRRLASLGFPKDANAISAAGVSLFGTDYWQQSCVNEMCLLSGGSWTSNAASGVWAAALNTARSGSLDSVGFRCACYPV
jgi:hypothetical protein